MKIHSKTSWFFKGVIYNIAAVLLLIIQGLVEILFAICGWWRHFRVQVQCLRCQPPRGGMYGNMAKRLKNKSNTPKDI